MGFRYEVWDPPGIATFVKKIAALRPLAASGTMYRRQSGRGQFTLPSDFARLGEVIEVDPANHANDVASTIRVYRDSTLVQELLVNASPNLVVGQDATVACDGIEAVMDWAVVEAWDWDGTADFASTVPDWVYGGRNLMPELTLGDLGSIREEWQLYLSGERYELDVSLATTGTYILTFAGNDTSALNWNATHTQIKTALEALPGITEVTVLQPDSDQREFFLVFENPKDLPSNLTANFGGIGGLGTLTKMNDGFDTSLNPTFTITVDGQTTSPALAWNASDTAVQGSPLTGNGLEGLSNINDVRVSGSGTAGSPWTITFYDPPDPTSVTVTFAAGTAVFTKIQEGDVDPSPITESMAIDATQTPSRHGCYDEPPIQVVTTPLDTGATWSLLVNATCQFGGSQIVLGGVKPGQLYQAEIRVRPTVAGEYVLVIRDEFENFIAESEPRHTLLSAGSFQTLEVENIEIPPGVTRVIMRVAVVDFSPSTWADFYVNWEGASFTEGMKPTTVGEIMGELLADAQTDHASSAFSRQTIDFVNKSFTDVLDSGGNAWTDAELSVNLPRGMTYRKVLDRIFGQLGYEWNLTPAATPGEWDLNIWNPGGRGTDHSAAATPSLLLGQGTLSGSATKQLPSGNIVISEGSQQYFSRAKNTASYGAIGRREWYQADISYSTTEVESWTDKTLSKFLDVSLKPRFEIADPPSDEWPVPIVNYNLGDTLNVDLSDGSGKISREVEAISWRTVDDGIVWGVHTGEAQFDGIGGSAGFSGAGVGGGAAFAPGRSLLASTGPINEGVRRLIDEFERLPKPDVPDAFVPFGAGAIPDVVLAADDTQETDSADLFSRDFPSDDAMLTAALERMAGRDQAWIHFLEGTYGWLNKKIIDFANLKITGAGIDATTIRVTSGTIASLIELQGGSDTDYTFEDLTFNEGPGTVTTALVQSGGQLTNARVWFNRVRFTASSKIGLDVNGSTSQIFMTDCRISSNATQGIYIRESDLMAKGCLFTGNGLAQAANGHSGYQVFMGCSFRDGGSSGISDSGIFGSGQVAIIGCEFDNHTNVAIDMDGSGGKPCVIVANTITNNGTDAQFHVGSMVGLNYVSGNGTTNLTNQQIITDHGNLTGLADDDHTQYLLANGSRVASFLIAGYLRASGLTGATSTGRWVGVTTSGAPVSGTFAVGDWVTTQDGNIFICTTAGTPGTWIAVGAGAATDVNAIHDNVAAEISALTQVTPANSDVFIIEDASDSFNKKKVPFSAIGGGGGGGAEWSPLLDVKTTPDNPPDDDFDDSTGMSGTVNGLDARWTAVSGVSGTVSLLETGDVAKYDLGTRGGWILLQAGNNAAQTVEMRQDYTLPDGDSLVLAIAPGVTVEASAAWGNNEWWIGLGLNNNDTGYDAGTWQAVFMDFDTAANQGPTQIIHFDGATIAAESATIAMGSLLYFRLLRSGLTYYGFYSIDGATWIGLRSFTVASAYDNLWIFMDNKLAGADPVPVSSVYYIRKGGGGVDPWV